MNETALSRAARIAVPILLGVLALQVVLGMRLLNASFDEVTHLPSGYSYLETGRVELNPQHPPLIKLLSAIPLRFIEVRSDFDPTRVEEPGYEWRFGRKFLQAGNADRMLFLGRLPVVLLSLLLAYLVYRWAKELFGIPAGLMALFLYAFSPNLIAHSRLVTMDLGLSCFFVLTLYFLWRFVRAGGRGNLTGAGIGLGLALATKFSAVLLLPAAALLLGLVVFLPPREAPSREAKRSRRKKAPAGSLWSRPFNDPSLGRRLKRALAVYLALLVLAALVVYAAYLFPDDPLVYWKGIQKVNADHRAGYMNYLMGEFKEGGWWYYFLVAFAFKTPVPALLLLGLWIALAVRHGMADRLGIAFLILPAVLLTAATSALADNFGIRYLLPVYPLIFVLASQTASFFLARRSRLVMGAVLALWYLGASLWIYPDHLAYFNELAGGPGRGWKYLDDSNIDWGTDLKRLKSYLDEQGTGRIKLAYWATASPDYYRIQHDRVALREFCHEPAPGLYAVSTHMLIRGELLWKAAGLQCDWLNRYEPVGRVGYSFYLFDIPGESVWPER